MGQGAKIPAALAALLLALGLVACGGDDEPEPATTGATQEQPSDGGSGVAEGEDGAEKNGTGGDKADGAGEPAGDFKPEQHEDSGGGAEQLRVRGGDNSVQEFGEEAGEAEFEAAATALHNFLDARASGEWGAACSFLSEMTVESLERLAAKGQGGDAIGCAAILANLTNPAAKGALLEEARKADVGSARIEGKQAFVIYRVGDAILTMPMRLEDGEWQVASIAPVPLN